MAEMVVKLGLKLNLRKIYGDHYSLLSILKNIKMIRLNFIAENYLYIKILSVL